jgi:hypothetical protein
LKKTRTYSSKEKYGGYFKWSITAPIVLLYYNYDNIFILKNTKKSFSDLRILMVILLSSTFRTIQVFTFAQWVPLETLQFSYSKPGRHDKTQEWPKVVLGKTNQSNILIILLLIYLYLEFWQTMVDIILHKKLKLEQHEPTPRKVREWTQSAPERWAVPVAIVTQIVLLKATLVFGNTFQMFGIFSWLINVWSYSMMAIQT